MNGQTTCTRKNKLIHVFLLPLETLMFQWPTVAHFRAGVDKLYIYSPTGTIYFTNRWWVRCFTLDFTFFFCPLFELQNSKPSVKIHRPKERSGQCLTGSGQQMIFFSLKSNHWLYWFDKKLLWFSENTISAVTSPRGAVRLKSFICGYFDLSFILVHTNSPSVCSCPPSPGKF